MSSDWVTLLERFGWPGFILLALLALLWKYAPKLIDAQVLLTTTATEHMKAVFANQQKTTETLASIAIILENKMNPNGILSNIKTNESLIQLSNILLALAQSMGPDTYKAVEPHILAMQDVLENE